MEQLSPYLLLAISLAANLVANTANKIFSSKSPAPYQRSVGVACISLVSCLVLLLWGGFHALSSFSLALGAAFGAVTFFLSFTLLAAFSLGPWSYTSVLTSLSMLLPAFSGAVFWHERIGALQFVGTALVIVCIVLSVPKKKADEKAASLKWFAYTAAAFFLNGSIGIMQKWHQNSPYAAELNEFLVVSFGVGTVCAVCHAVFLARRAPADGPRRVLPLPLPRAALLFALGGAGTATIHKLNLYLSGVLPGAVFFPTVNGGALVLTSLAAFLFFREKLTGRQWAGLVIGLAAVLLLTL